MAFDSAVEFTAFLVFFCWNKSLTDLSCVRAWWEYEALTQCIQEQRKGGVCLIRTFVLSKRSSVCEEVFCLRFILRFNKSSSHK